MTQPSAKPVSLRIRLPFETEEAFIERYGSNVVRGGMFIATHAIKPEGTELVFQVVLADGSPLLRGTGTVAKAQVDEGGARAGMTIRFGRLDAESLARVERILEHRNGSAKSPSEPVLTQGEREAPEPVQPERSPEGGAEGPVPPQGEPEPSEPVQPEPSPEGGVECPVPPQGEPEAPDPSTPAPRASAQGEREAHGLGPVLGVELDGDTLLVACSVDPDPRPLALLGGRLELPAVVARAPDGAWCLGHEVRALPESIERQWLSSPEVEPAAAAHLFEAVRRAAESRLRQPVDAMVLALATPTAPAVRKSLDAAARLAGFHTVRHLQAPTAAAQAFAHGKGLARQRVLVLSWREEALEASLAVATGEDLEVVACFGEAELGTFALNERIAEDLLGDGETPSAALREAVAKACAQMREGDLSTLRLEVGDRPLLTREKVDALTSDLLARALPQVHAVLAAAGTTPEGVDELVLCGEAWSAAESRAWLGRLLPRPLPPPRAKGMAAIGAALFGHALAERSRGRHAGRISEVLPWPVSLALRDGTCFRILEPRTRLPAEKSLNLRADSEKATTLAFFRGTGPDPRRLLGVLSAPPSTQPGEVELHLRVDEDAAASAELFVPGAPRFAGPLEPADLALDALLETAPEPEACGVTRGKESPGLLRRLFGKKR